MTQFVHLHVHSEYSVIDSTLKVKPLVGLAAKNQQPALALTDHINLFALIKFYGAAMSAGVKPIIGADVWIENDAGEVFKVVLLCQNTPGYLNLSHLISQAYLKNQKVIDNQNRALIKQSWLAQGNEGLIVLSGGREGDVGQAILAEKPNLVASRLKWWQQYFPERFYLELVRTGRENEEVYIADALEVASRYEIPVVATNDVRFEEPEDFDAHEVRVCINEGFVLEDPNRPKRYSEEQYFRSSEEMIELFKDIPEAIENTVEIARRCSLSLTLGTYFLPDFPVPEGMTEAEYFIDESQKGLEERLAFLYGHLSAEEFAEKRKEYDERLKFELDIIIQMGFPGYFFIVADFIQWGKDHGVPVGPGRGSGAGSLVAYVLKITDLDPLEYDLLFERFLNPERVSMPDFDVDFCMDRRDEVIDYVSRNYGKDHVSQIVTFGTMAAKAVVRDVGRVLSLGYGMVDGIAKLIPNDLGIKLKDALKQEEQLQQRYDTEEDVKQLLDLALKLEGTVRNTGKHAGGVVIAPKPLDYYCPILCDADGNSVVTQLDKNDVEYAGLVKFDFLGLRTLTIIDWALQEINAGKKPGDEGFVDIARIPLDDPQVFELIKTGKTTGIFQLESSGMQNLIVKLKPDCFEDIIALVALFRPGPLDSGMVDNFIARKHGKEKVSYPDAQYQHMSLQPILEPTYGIILYQEQVMQIAQVLAGYTLGGADMLRRAMGKKQPEEMEKQRSIFKEGAIKNNVDGDLAMKIFDLVEKFAGYGFNKSHSAAYALVSYQSAWLKTHFPAEFMAAQISSDMDNTDKVVHMVNECYSMGLKVRQPHINECQIHFKAVKGKPKGQEELYYGLGAIKGVGAAALEGIIESRQQDGPYKDLFDFCMRSNKKANKRVMEALILSGAFDCLHDNRNAMLESLPMAIQKAEQKQKDIDAGQSDLFGDLMAFEDENADTLLDVAPFIDKVKLKHEKEVLGHYMTGHPIHAYRQELDAIVGYRLSSLKPEKWNKRWAAGLIVETRAKVTKSGTKMGFLALDDQTARLEVVLKPAVFESSREILKVDTVVLVFGEVAEDSFNGGIKLDAEQVVSLAEYRAEKARAIKIQANEQTGLVKIEQLLALLNDYRVEQSDSGLPLVVNYQNAQATAQLVSQEGWYLLPEDDLLDVLRSQGWQPEVVN
ncbi:DNA polymerase III subunit alpha [Thiosulfativibrio zosterae]|uniref:DNA polymerase III subunit alpha n=1 Tax=Thiosulfativibrio zosterae TaxID=2675053 RepID=A0A6F8PN08_9GAMM|nr:DNA polymerase III subunit alpha [Thiosulfativibrio zosterae]BBP43503.1 DNA-directed DNA polymerase [Thiosulfativibrio zosterae]